MTVLQSMKRGLAPLGVYRVNEPHLSNELRTYADEIERLYSGLDSMMTECFLATAIDRGLKEYEELFGPARDDLSAAQRRQQLMLRFSIGESDFTYAGLCKALDSFGLEYQITEFPSLCRLNIVAQADYTKAEQEFINREVAKIVPPHLEFQMVFNTLMWSELDARDKTFAQLDHDDLNWNEIDELE